LVKGEVAFDVGSCTGLYAILAAKAQCISVAFEANPIILSRLELNVVQNQVSVEIHNKAVSNSIGFIPFYIKRGTALTSASTLYKTEGFQKISVPVTTLPTDRKVCAIKIDVEGAEYEVLDGARDLLEKYKPRIMVECLTEEQEDRITSLLSDYGYSKIRLDSRNFGFP